MLEDLQALVNRLKHNPKVVGIVRYGRRQVEDMSPGGDLDLFVFIDQRPDDGIESLHFSVQGIPVDLNIRTLDDLNREEPLIPFDIALADGDILYDPQGELQSILPDLENRWHIGLDELSENTRAFLRFSQRHALDKVRHRLESNPLMCELLLASSIYWLVQNYFLIHQMTFPGERAALVWFQENDPEVYQLLGQFFALSSLEQKLETIETLSETILAPIGGLWQTDEILALGINDNVQNLQKQGLEAFRSLLNIS